MRRPLLAIAMGATVILAACAGGSSAPSSGSSPGASTPVSASDKAPATGDQFGGDVCSALTKDEVVAAGYAQGTPVFDSTDTQQDEATGKAVVCQYLAKFGDNPATVAVAVSLLDAGAFADHDQASMVAPAATIPGIGNEAYLVQPVPGQFEVWVSAAHGAFKVATQSKDASIALATLAAGRD